MYRELHSSQCRERAFTPEDKGSGNGEKKHFNLFSRLAKRSTEKGPKLLQRKLKVTRSRDHSVEMGACRDLESARTFRRPGRCLATRVIS